MAECKNIMVYVETAEGNPVKVGLEMLSPAKKLADKVTAVVIGGGVADAAKEVAKAGADQLCIRVYFQEMLDSLWLTLIVIDHCCCHFIYIHLLTLL